MSTCSQCGQNASFWQRDLWTGLCRRCLPAQGPTAQKTHQRRLTIAIRAGQGVGALLVLLFFVAILYCTPLLDVLFFDKPISSEEWKQADVRGRGRMARDLVASGILKGKSSDKIRELLGTPDEGNLNSTSEYRVDIGYRWITKPCISNIDIMYEKGEDRVYGAYLH